MRSRILSLLELEEVQGVLPEHLHRLWKRRIDCFKDEVRPGAFVICLLQVKSFRQLLRESPYSVAEITLLCIVVTHGHQ